MLNNLLSMKPTDKPLSKRSHGLNMSRKATDKGKHWTDRDKLKAIAAYIATGNATEVEKLTGIPAGTVNYWKTLPWWFEEVEKLRRSEDEELISQHTKILKSTLEKLVTRLETGDIVLTKTGEQILIPIKAKDLSNIANALGQRREKLREGVTQQTVKQVTVAERLKQLEDQFTKFVTSKVVEGEVIHKVVEIDAPNHQEIANEREERVEEARKEGIETLRKEGNDERSEEVEKEVLNAKQIEETGEDYGSGSPQSSLCEEGRDSSFGCQRV